MFSGHFILNATVILYTTNTIYQLIYAKIEQTVNGVNIFSVRATASILLNRRIVCYESTEYDWKLGSVQYDGGEFNSSIV